MKRTLLALLIILTFSFQPAIAQDEKKADELFTNGNFEEALEEYLLLFEGAGDNVMYNYRIAVCYLNTNIDKSLALPFLQTVVKSDDYDPNTNYLLGRAYHYAYEFDKAITAYEIFKQYGEGNEANLGDVEKQIEYCQNAKELMKFPLKVTFENLGPSVNSPYPDYFPFIPADESFVVFNSKRDDGSTLQPDGSYLPNVYMAKVKDGKFEKAQVANQIINTNDGVEEVIGMTTGGEQVLLYFDNNVGFGDIFIGRIVDQKFDKPQKLPKSVNSKDREIAATISADGAAIYFASDREGGYGGTDLYVTRKLPNGKWGPAQNLGPSINTAWDEDFPNLSADGDVLYFSSKGHTSMGGYDIFKAFWDPSKQKWSGVRNIGYPINTPEDNMNFRLAAGGKYGYIAALREGGQGDLDIYRVNFKEVEPRYTVMNGTIQSESGAEVDLSEAYISVVDLDTEEEYGNYLPNPNSKRFVMILPPGRYNLLIEVPGYAPWEEDFEVLDKASYRAYIEMQVLMKSE